MCTYLVLHIYTLFIGESDSHLEPLLKRKSPELQRPLGCRTSSRTPSTKTQQGQGDGGTPSHSRTKTMASRKKKDKGKGPAPPQEEEGVSDDNVKTMELSKWRNLRRENPYRFPERTHKEPDLRFWTKS